jgi:hypothetical protein
VILTRRPGRSARRVPAIAGLSVVGLLLSACGSIGIHPGEAAVVGDSSVSMNTINSKSTLYCQGLASTIATTQTAQIPMRLIRQYVAKSLAQKLLGQELADQYDVTPGPQYTQGITQLKGQLTNMTADQRDAILYVESGPRYLQWIQVAIGRQLLAASGQSAGSRKDAFQRGVVATQEWVKSHQVEIDPAFGVSVDGGQFQQVLDQTSYPLSTLASQGAAQATAQQANPDYTGQLTPAQVCG